MRDSLDTAISKLSAQARIDRDEAIRLGSQQISKDSAEHLGSKAEIISQTLNSIQREMGKKIEDLDKELRDLREYNKSQFDNVGIAVGALARSTGTLSDVLQVHSDGANGVNGWQKTCCALPGSSKVRIMSNKARSLVAVDLTTPS